MFINNICTHKSHISAHTHTQIYIYIYPCSGLGSSLARGHGSLRRRLEQQKPWGLERKQEQFAETAGNWGNLHCNSLQFIFEVLQCLGALCDLTVAKGVLRPCRLSWQASYGLLEGPCKASWNFSAVQRGSALQLPPVPSSSKLSESPVAWVPSSAKTWPCLTDFFTCHSHFGSRGTR